MKQVKSPEEVPNGPHYAFIEFRKITESSGWGSENDSQVTCPNYYVTEDRAEWIKFIEEMEAKRRNNHGFFVPYVAFEVKNKAIVETKISVKVD